MSGNVRLRVLMIGFSLTTLRLHGSCRDEAAGSAAISAAYIETRTGHTYMLRRFEPVVRTRPMCGSGRCLVVR